MTDGNSNDLESAKGICRLGLDASQRKPFVLRFGQRWRLGSSMRFGAVRSWTQAVSGVTAPGRSRVGSGSLDCSAPEVIAVEHASTLAGAGSNPAGGFDTFPGWSKDPFRKEEKNYSVRVLSRIGTRSQSQHQDHPTIKHGLWGNSDDIA